MTIFSRLRRLSQISALISLAFVASQAQADFTPTEDGLYAVFDTTEGQFAAKLYFEQAPLTVANFVGLAEGSVLRWDETEEKPITGPFYDGTIFHRIVSDIIILAGAPIGNTSGDPGYTIPDEANGELIHDRAGLLSMDTIFGPNTGGSRFFITLAPVPARDGRSTIFGEIVEGIEILNTINGVPLDENDRPETDIILQHVSILRVGDAAGAFDPKDYEVPNVLFPKLDLSLSDSKSTATFERKPNADYILRRSSNLSDWAKIEENLKAAYEVPSSHEIDFTSTLSTSQSAFLSVMEVTIPRTIDPTGTSLTITLEDEADYSLDLSGVFEGTYSFGTFTGEIEYIWWVLPGRDQLYVVFSDSEPLGVQFYLTWESETGGTVFAVDVVDGELYTGTFTANARPDSD